MADAGIRVIIGTEDAQKALRELAAAAKGPMRNSLRRGIRAAAQPIAQGIRDEASWSSRIPDAVSLRVTTKAVSVVIRPSVAPEANALNNDDQPGMFRHPVYADISEPRSQWAWTEQEARPFLQAGAQRGRGEADRRFDALMTEWEKAAGFK